MITLLSFTSLSRYSYISAFRTHFYICVESYGSKYHRQTIPKIPKPSMKINRKLLDSNRKPILWSYLSNGNLSNHNNNGLKMSVNLTKFNTYSNLNWKLWCNENINNTASLNGLVMTDIKKKHHLVLDNGKHLSKYVFVLVVKLKKLSQK